MDSEIRPSTYIAAITPGDSTDLQHNGTYPKALYIADATGGNLVVKALGRQDVAITFVIPAGAAILLPVQVYRVMSATTVAAGIVALY